MAGYEGTETRSGKMIFEPILEEGVFRFDCSADDRNAAFPSISFENPKFPPNTSFYGTGEVSGQLERTGKRIFTWNTDAWGYGAGTTSLYQSHPWVLAVLPNGEALGVLADTTRRCEIDLRKEANVKLISSSPYPVITFGPFASPVDVLASFSRAVGTVFMPPKWSLGYHQCRWSYHSDARVREIVKTFREKGAIPDPKTLAEDLHQHGFKAIWMLDPGIKKEEGYFVYDSGSKRDIWIQTADGKTFVGDVWPGPCVFPDFTQSSARSWWANLVKDFITNGVDGIWNDMNEPAVFKTVTKTMPDSNIHRGDSELGGRQNHSHYHNVYGMLMARSTYEGMKLANEQKRSFVLTRAGFVGSQRYAATWTGDNLSTWEHLHMSISMVVQLKMQNPFQTWTMFLDNKGTELSRTPVEVKSGDWALKVVPWIVVELFPWSTFLQTQKNQPESLGKRRSRTTFTLLSSRSDKNFATKNLPIESYEFEHHNLTGEKEKQQWRIEHLGYDLPENGGLVVAPALMARAHLEVPGVASRTEPPRGGGANRGTGG
ncbi:Alpha-glucosidase 2 [Sesamum angolense]|uniref:Alpha-glucosidase 2 n=1 Tax=Sesamum angolense TaxID=2727404 RepID=A0AAE1WX36_9LAMI|nr:Alpha-glucosidase 2 [Sesamum angolense]